MNSGQSSPSCGKRRFGSAHRRTYGYLPATGSRSSWPTRLKVLTLPACRQWMRAASRSPSATARRNWPELPDEIDRAINETDELPGARFVRRHLPAADGPRTDASVCLYTLSPDRHFVIDRHPEFDNVVIAGGLSGHGFKFLRPSWENCWPIWPKIRKTERTSESISDRPAFATYIRASIEA